MIRINQHIQSLKPSATLAINQEVKRLRSQGEDICHFGFGQSPFQIHDSIVNELIANAENNKYLPTIGLEILRETIASFLTNYQNISSLPEDILIGPGSKELLYQTILLLEGVVLIPKGSWVSYGPQIQSKGGDYVVLDTYLKNNFKLQPEELKTYCEDNKDIQKSLIINSPNNPTGAVYSEDELKALADICRAYDVIVLSDEIYSQVNFNEESSPSIATYYPEKTFIFGGLSKVFSAGGYRLGFLKLPKELSYLHTTYRSLFSETFSAVASPVQYAAVEAFKMKSELKEYVNLGSDILKGVSNYVYTELVKYKIDCTIPQGSFYVMIGFNNFKEKINNLGIDTSSELANYLLKNYKVALLPGSDFYFNEEDLFFRLAFVDFNGEDVMRHYKNQTTVDDNLIKTNCPNIFNGIKNLIEFTKTL